MNVQCLLSLSFADQTCSLTFIHKPLREKTQGPLTKRSKSAEPLIDPGVGSGQDRVLGQVVFNLGLRNLWPPRLISAGGKLKGKRTGAI